EADLQKLEVEGKTEDAVDRPDPVEGQGRLACVSLEEDRPLSGVEVLDVEEVFDVVAVRMRGQRIEPVEAKEDADREDGEEKAEGEAAVAGGSGGSAGSANARRPGPEPEHERGGPGDRARGAKRRVAHLPEREPGERHRNRYSDAHAEAPRRVGRERI